MNADKRKWNKHFRLSASIRVHLRLSNQYEGRRTRAPSDEVRRPVGAEGEAAVPGLGGVAGERLLVHFVAPAGLVRNGQVAVFDQDRVFDQVFARGLVVGVGLQNQEVG